MIINRSFSFSLSNKERFGSLKSLVLLVVIAILATSNTYAQASFETIGGLRYLIYPDAKTAALTFNPSGEKYSGNIVVPEKVKASNGVEYPVTAFADNAFKDCDGLKSITIPSSVTSLGEWCFSGCSSLTSITIPSSVTSLGYACFNLCSGLTGITIPSSVTSLSASCFFYCSGLTSITIPSSVTSLGDACFDGCTGLTSITIPSSVTSLGISCFAQCYGLTNITIPSSVTSLGETCFSQCLHLTNITIPSSVTFIDDGCFQECSSLTSITIPSSVTSLGGNCFIDCTKLEKATFQGELPKNTIGCSLQSTCIIYVPKTYLQDYKDALGSKYSYIYASKDDESGEQKPMEQCAVPTISYADGKLTFASSTPNAEYHYSITDSDIASNAYCQDGTVKLYAAYNISAYATADGYKPSDKATATLYWVEANLQNNPTNINQTTTRGIIITSNDGIVTLSGLNNDETVRFYTVDGKQLGAAKAVNGAASQAVSESIVIAKMGNQTIKIAVK